MKKLLLYIGGIISGLIGAVCGGVGTAYLTLSYAISSALEVQNGDDWVPFVKAVILFLGIKFFIFIGAVVVALLFCTPFFIAIDKCEE